MIERSMTDRTTARRLAAESVAAGEPTAWFETLYAAAEQGEAVVPWADLEPNPFLVRWAAAGRATGHGRAIVIGCGLGDDAEYLAGLGYAVVAFDVAPTAVAAARRRFPSSEVDYRVADLLDLPPDWIGAFDFVLEVYTVQVLLDEARRTAIANSAALVGPGGTLLVLARARDEDGDPGQMPWPLTRAEIDAFAADGLSPIAVDEVLDDEDPPVRRWVAEFHRS
ncbi:class I SAM-dependent methyltransferase [Hamadaea sp.]|uniref:class I SAM-dependent methyltransferase n=1 Tax=Hamadaea sp. TaxID=2024425 RepID=UPI0025C4474F|nr:class I SAM-dependent methyltransferase [Hamadaea sp.]